MSDKTENNQVMVRVRKALASQGKSQKDLAAFLGVPAANVSKWIRTGHLPFRHWNKFAEFLGVSWQYMIGDETYDQMLYRMHLEKAQKTLLEKAKESPAEEQRFQLDGQPVIAVGNEIPADAILIPEYHVKFCCGNGISQDAKPQFEINVRAIPYLK